MIEQNPAERRQLLQLLKEVKEKLKQLRSHQYIITKKKLEQLEEDQKHLIYFHSERIYFMDESSVYQNGLNSEERLDQFIVNENTISLKNGRQQWFQILLNRKIKPEKKFVFWVDIKKGSNIMVGVVNGKNNSEQSSYNSGQAIAYDCHTGRIFNGTNREIITRDRVRSGMCLRISIDRKQSESNVIFQILDQRSFQSSHAIQSPILNGNSIFYPYFQFYKTGSISWFLKRYDDDIYD